MNDKKIAFILCTNDERELNECLGYLDRLIVPQGYEKDVIAVSEAPSMAEGYNAGMQSTDAKYKVYIHQDTFIVNQNFIADILCVFNDPDVGLVGMIGARQLPKDSYAVTAWDTGVVCHNGVFDYHGYQEKGQLYTQVEAVDGLLLATQYDIKFREDLFTDWDFYDISACYEFRRRGYKVVVPYQEESWTFHNNKYSKMVNYDKNRAIFAKEYSKDFALDEDIKMEPVQELEELKFQAVAYLTNLIDQGKIHEVSNELSSSDSYNFLCFRDIQILAEIYKKETVPTIFDWSQSAKSMFERLNDLKWFLLRVEYGVEIPEAEYRYYTSNYSIWAILQVCMNYCTKRKTVISKLAEYLHEKEIIDLLKKRLKDRCDMLGAIKENNDYSIYNFERIKGQKTLLYCNEATDMKSGSTYDFSDVVIIAKKATLWIETLVEKNVPVILCKNKRDVSQAVLLYLMEYDWNIERVILFEKDAASKEIERLICKTPIKSQNRLEFIEETEQDEPTKYVRYADSFRKAIWAKTSIVILSYNTLAMTRDCIESIRRTLSTDEYELIIVDNASTDGSVDYLKAQSDIKLICNSENKGFAGGCNQGIQIAEAGNDIWLLNSDTLVPKHALFWLKAGLYSEPNIGACGSISNFCPNYQNVVETQVDKENYELVAKKYNRYQRNALEKKNWLVGFSLLIKRMVLEQVGLLDERFFPGNFEDNDLSYRIVQAGYKLMLCHNSFVFHYGSQSFKKANIISPALVENRKRFEEKWGFNPEVHTEIKTRHIAMLHENAISEFRVLDMNAGVGATLNRLEYQYANAYVTGIEANEKVSEIASANGCRMNESFTNAYDYVFVQGLKEDALRMAQQFLKEHGKIIGRCSNRYYKELTNDMVDIQNSYSGEELINLLAQYGYEIIELSYEKGNSIDLEKVSLLCSKYSCDRTLVEAEIFYFVARHGGR